MKVDSTKVDARTWPIPNNTTQVRALYGLASVYRRFTRNFSTIIAPITECTKKGSFTWTKEAQEAFKVIKEAICNPSVLELPDFSQPFEEDCDASGTGIGAVSMQNGRPIAYFSEKLKKSRINYSNYDKEFYAMVKALDH